MSDYKFYKHEYKYNVDNIRKGDKIDVGDWTLKGWKDHYMKSTGADKFNQGDFESFLYQTRGITIGKSIPKKFQNMKQRNLIANERIYIDPYKNKKRKK